MNTVLVYGGRCSHTVNESAVDNYSLACNLAWFSAVHVYCLIQSYAPTHNYNPVLRGNAMPSSDWQQTQRGAHAHRYTNAYGVLTCSETFFFFVIDTFGVFFQTTLVS